MQLNPITVKLIAYSRAPSGATIATFEIEYQRFIHGELMTHRLFSRNAASSRAIPIEQVIHQVETNPAMPIHWGKNQSGMQAKEELSPVIRMGAEWAWRMASKAAAKWAKVMHKLGLHKQATNRILEPFQIMKTVVTATCYENFFWLRDHEDAQPEIADLARKMRKALDEAVPFDLEPGEWHLPYVHRFRFSNGSLHYLKQEYKVTHQTTILDSYTLEEAKAVSASCCAQVSFRKLDDDLGKAERVYARLVESEPVHASPFEHQATPMKHASYEAMLMARFMDGETAAFDDGVTHADREDRLWSGNLCGFIQHRQLIPNNVKKEA